MARFAVFSIFVVAVAVTGAYAGLIPDILPIPAIPDVPDFPKVLPTPSSKEQAIEACRRGGNIGKKGINIRISAFIASANQDPTLTPICKQCIAQKCNEVRQNIVNDIEDTTASLQNAIQDASDIWLPVWIQIIGDLPNLVSGILVSCNQQINTAKSDCIAQTANAA